jgi:hypothetical protein
MDLKEDNKIFRVGIGALSAVTATALGLMVLFAVPAAQAAVVSCPASIVACGCTITDSNTHTLVNDISSTDGLTGKGDCIDIKHAGAVLEGFDGVTFHVLTGGGSGAGVRILSGAKRATVQNLSSNSWDIGIEDDAPSANINDDDFSGNGTAGVLLKSVSKTVVDDFDGDFAAGSCIILKNSNQNTFQDFDASDCGGDGITATGSNRNSFSEFIADFNGGDGVNFMKSSGNSLSNFDAGDTGGNGNGGDGVAFTKHSNKNSASGFVADENGLDGIFIDPSSNDKVDDGEADDNTLNGIEIDKGSKQDSVIFNDASGNFGTDLVDNNPNCANGKNVWENNFFGTSNDSCIH